MAKGVALGEAHYITSYVPCILDVPKSNMVAFYKNFIYHGFYENNLKIGENNYDISSIKCDLQNGEDSYIDSNYKDSFLNKHKEVIGIKEHFDM